LALKIRELKLNDSIEGASHPKIRIEVTVAPMRTHSSALARAGLWLKRAFGSGFISRNFFEG
jgi:hypothetical protein